MRDIVADFLVRYPKVNVVAHATDQNVDIVRSDRSSASLWRVTRAQRSRPLRAWSGSIR
jgi:hypothetical protein